MRNLLNRFIHNESGATAIEYALLTALIAIALVGSMTDLGGDLSDSLTNTANSVP